MSNSPKIGIIILNYNGLSDTIDCLKSVYGLSYPNFEVIVVDNGSAINPMFLINQNFKKVIKIQNKNNLGFAQGSNIGIKKALELNCEYILLLNNDTKVEKNLLNALILATEKKPLGGIFGGTILKFDKPDIIDHIGGFWDKNKADFISYGTNKHISSLEQYNMKNVDYVCGCVMLIKKKVLEKIGFLEKDFFLLWEESDFCYRAKKAGFEIWAVSDALVWHKISASFSGGKIHSDYFWWRNRLLWIKRNLSFKEKTKIYFKVIISDFFKLYKLTFLKYVQFHFLKIFKKSKITEKKLLKLLRYKARCKGVLDYFLKKLGPCPYWIQNPKNHKHYYNVWKTANKK